MRVFQNFRGRRRVFLGFLEGFLPASEKVAKQGFLRVFWEILGSQSLAGDALCGHKPLFPSRYEVLDVTASGTKT